MRGKFVQILTASWLSLILISPTTYARKICESELIRLAEPLYSPSLPYHNFQHALDVLSAARQIYDQIVLEGRTPRPSWHIILKAALGHDAGYQRDHKKMGFSHKEAYSAHLTAEWMRSLKYPEEEIAAVSKTILATHRDAKIETVEEKILRAADLSRLADSFPNFMEKNRALRRELQSLQNTQVYSLEWKEMVLTQIEIYLNEHIQLTSKYWNENGVSNWHHRVRENLTRFLQTDL